MSQQINLYNPTFELKSDLLSLSGAAVVWGFAVGIVVLVLVAMAARTIHLEQTLAQVATERDAARAEMTQRAAQLAGRKSASDLAAEVQRLEAALSARQKAMSVLQEGMIGNTSGFSEQLSAFTRQSFDGLSLTRLHIVNAGRDFVLEGRARHPELVPEYLQRLNREEVMRGHAFAELEMRQPKLLDQRAHDRYVEFRLATLPRRRTTAEDAR